jgi:hypothetical protein
MTEEQQEYKALMTKEDAMSALVTAGQSLFFNVAKFEHAQRVSKVLMASTMVPEHFRNNIGNCIIALNYAERIRADVFMVMQNMYVVHGRPGVEGKLVIALINQSGKYSEPLKFEFSGTGEEYGCTAYTKETKSGEVVRGPKITWRLVVAEGWNKDKGTTKSKWVTMPDLMYRYRAASWFANTNCPELKLGMQTVEEINDFIDLQPDRSGKYSVKNEPEPEPINTDLFDQYASNQVHDTAKMMEFIALSAKTLGKTEAEVKFLAQNDLPDFWKQFAAWQKKQAPATQEAPKTEQKKKPKDKLEPEKPAQMEMAPSACPNRSDDDIMTKEFCDKCKSRPGCPVWEPEPGSNG